MFKGPDHTNLVAALVHPEVDKVCINPQAELDLYPAIKDTDFSPEEVWDKFVSAMSTQHNSPFEDPEAAYSKYHGNGGGFSFWAALDRYGTLVAGMAISPSANNSLVVDALYSQMTSGTPRLESTAPAGTNLAATAMHQLLNRRVFQHYSGQYHLNSAVHLDLPVKNIAHSLQARPGDQTDGLNLGFLRGIKNYAIAGPEGYRIPLPGQIVKFVEPLPIDRINTYQAVEQRVNFVGGFHYFPEAEPGTQHVDFFRKRIYVGSLVISFKGNDKHKIVDAYSAVGGKLILPEPEEDEPYVTARHVRFLKLLTERDKEIAELILN